MPRGKEPSWEMKKVIVDLAAKQGQDNLSAIQRDIDKLVGEGKPLEHDSTPDARIIKRVIEEDFQMLDPEIVAREFPRYVWKMRHDFKEIAARLESERGIQREQQSFSGQEAVTKTPPLGELVDLLHRWQEQALFPSLDQLLRYFGREVLQVELLRQETDSQQALEIYDAAKRHHLQGIPEAGGVFPRVIEEGLFQRLRQDYRDDPVWEAQESWGLAYGAYLEAFCWFFVQVQHEFEQLLVGAAANRPTGKNEVRERGLEAEVDRIQDLLDERKKKDEQLVIFLKLAAVIVSCDLFTLGMEQLPANERWALEEVDKLQTVRAEATNSITEFAEPSPLPLDQIVTAAKLLWEHQPEIRQKTGDLLGKLKSLQAADEDLQSKLMAFEWRLYGVAGS